MTKNLGESVFAKIRNLSRERRAAGEPGADMPDLATRYVVERFLHRLALVGAGDSFALKGGMLWFVWRDGRSFRPTTDVDLHGVEALGRERLEAVFRSACSAEADDGLVFDLSELRIEAIREGFIPGARFHTKARLHTMEIKFKADVGFGDAVTPAVVETQFPALLPSFRAAPRVLAYPRESVVAEKLHAMVEKGLDSTRYKDYFDLWVIMGSYSFDGAVLAEAIRNTFKARADTPIDVPPPGLSDAYFEDAEHRRVWAKNFAGPQAKAKHAMLPPDLKSTVLGIREFALPAMLAAKGEAAEPGEWRPGDGWGEPAPFASP